MYPSHPNHTIYKRHRLPQNMSFVVDVVQCATLDPLGNQTFVDATIPGTWSYIALPPKILVQTRLGLRVAVFARFRPLLRKGHTCDQNDLRLVTYQPFLAGSHNLRKFIYAQTGKYLKGAVTFLLTDFEKNDCVI